MAAMTIDVAAATTDFSFPTSDNGGSLPTEIGSQTFLGCPISSFIAIESACSTVSVPSCVDGSINSACCGSLQAFGTSAANCYNDHSLACLDTSELSSYLSSVHITVTGPDGGDNPCAQFGFSSMTAAPSATTSESSETETTEPGTTATTGSKTGTGTASASSTATKSAGNRAKASAGGLKMFLGYGLAFAIAGLAL